MMWLWLSEVRGPQQNDLHFKHRAEGGGSAGMNLRAAADKTGGNTRPSEQGSDKGIEAHITLTLVLGDPYKAVDRNDKQEDANYWTKIKKQEWIKEHLSLTSYDLRSCPYVPFGRH